MDIDYDELWVQIAEELDLKLGRRATDEEVQEEFDKYLSGIDDHFDDSLNGN
jgi:hypothetical protein